MAIGILKKFGEFSLACSAGSHDGVNKQFVEAGGPIGALRGVAADNLGCVLETVRSIARVNSFW